MATTGVDPMAIPAVGATDEEDLGGGSGEPTMREMMRTMQLMLRQYSEQIKALEKKLEDKDKEMAEILKKATEGEPTDAAKNKDGDKSLKPMNMKDVKMPTEYSGKPEEFQEWYQKFQNLLVTRHSVWKDVRSARLWRAARCRRRLSGSCCAQLRTSSHTSPACQ